VITLCTCGRPADRATARSSILHSTQRYYDEYYDEDYDEDYHEHEIVPEPVAMINCYSCHYQNERGYAQGSVNCKEPFSKGQIAIVKCAGPCAVGRTIYFTFLNSNSAWKSLSATIQETRTLPALKERLKLYFVCAFPSRRYFVRSKLSCSSIIEVSC